VFREHNPVPVGPLYRRLRWGAYLDLFILDLRSYRSPNTAADKDGKSMLGAEQKAWLLRELPSSTARHKVIVSSVPIAVPTGDQVRGIDSWVGFETELAEVLSSLAAAGVRELTFLTTDVHFTAVHRFQPVEGAPLVVHEIIVGPMSAGLYPVETLDPTFAPKRLFFHGPDVPSDQLGYDEALAYMTAGVLEVDGDAIDARILNADGAELWRQKLWALAPDQDRPGSSPR
jgi:alkaline phosphatase D